jgi:hypothetical protein
MRKQKAEKGRKKKGVKLKQAACVEGTGESKAQTVKAQTVRIGVVKAPLLLREAPRTSGLVGWVGGWLGVGGWVRSVEATTMRAGLSRNLSGLRGLVLTVMVVEGSVSKINRQ